MTLTTTGLNEYARRLYRGMRDGGRMSDDTCVEAYEKFVSRLRRYRDRHPDAPRVSVKFLRKCEGWVAADILRRRKRERVRTAVALECAGREAGRHDALPACGGTVLFMKMESVFVSWRKRKPKAASYIRIFLLKHAWHLSAARVRLFAPLVDGRKSDFVRQVKAVRAHMADRVSAAVREQAAAARYWHRLSVKTDVEAREAEGKTRAALRDRKPVILARQRRALEALRSVKLTPSVRVLARIAGVTPERVRHACEQCARELRKCRG